MASSSTTACAAAFILLHLLSGSAAAEHSHAGSHHKHGSYVSCEQHGICSSVNTVPVPEACSLALRQRIAWGVSTAAYQIEGGWDEGGRTPSVWDQWSQEPGRVYQSQNGNVACDHYHRWQEDIQLMQQLGLKHYRLSLSWTRIIPGGFSGSPVNHEGVRFYKQLLQGLRAAGIEPMVTLFHWDLPQVLQDAYGGFNSSRLVDDFTYYADSVFSHLGRFVKTWITFNEPLVTCDLGFKAGTFPPGWKDGNAGTFRCGHTHLLAHARVVKLYRDKYRASQGGKLSIAVPGWFAMPNDVGSEADQAAAERMMLFKWGWFTEPLLRGDYPEAMKQHFGDLLPGFSEQERQLLRGSADFIGVNCYTSRYIAPGEADGMPWVESTVNASGHTLGLDADVPWLKVTPGALRGVLNWITRRYGPVELKVTENGVPVPRESGKPLQEALRDAFRLDFYRGYIEGVCQAVAEDGVNLTGYYAWSLMDNFEWLDGYRPRFGITYVDYQGGLTRIPKMSAWWLSQHFFRPGASAADASDEDEIKELHRDEI